MTSVAKKRYVLLTGAAGKVGQYLVSVLLSAGYYVIATDVAPVKTRRGLDEDNYAYIRCDLTNHKDIQALILGAKPDVLVHTAAIVAPISYAVPEQARLVNLEASLCLLKALEKANSNAHFIFCSSYSVHGPKSPYTDSSMWTSETPLKPSDAYAQQKALFERVLTSSRLRWSILRLGSIMDAAMIVPKHYSYKPFAYMVPLEQREHGVDVMDVVTAVVNCVGLDKSNQIYMIGGDTSWMKTAREFRTAVYASMGLPNLLEQSFRQPPVPNLDEGWYCENWMDTARSQAILNYQHHRFDDFVRRLRRNNLLKRYLYPLIKKTIYTKMLCKSPYWGPNAIVPGRTLKEDLEYVFSPRVENC